MHLFMKWTLYAALLLASSAAGCMLLNALLPQ